MTTKTFHCPSTIASRGLYMLVILISLFATTSTSAQDTCDEYEQGLIVAFAQCLMLVVSGGQCYELQDLNERLQTELSPSCQAALVQAQQQQLPTPPYSSELPPPSVYDHGGGTYSVPGLGACGPGGCIPFD